MNAQELSQAIAGGVNEGTRTRMIYGEPITAQGRTVVPVARVAFGFGAGVEPEEHGEEAGGGGGGWAFPVGVIEISERGTRFVPVRSGRKAALFLLLGVGLGMWLGRRQRRHPFGLR